MLSWKSKLLLVAAVTGLAAWTGYRAERSATDAAGKPTTTVRSVVKRLMTPGSQRASVDRLEELRQAIGRKYPSRQEAAALWAVIRAFSAEEVKAALETLPKESDRRVNGEISDMLYYRWAQLEPQAAATAVIATGDEYRRRTIYTVLSAWAQHDPDAAIRWGRESGHNMARNAATQAAARQWVNDDPATALSRARAEFPEAVQNVIRHLISKLSETPESRQQLFALLAKEVPHQDDPGLFQRLAWDLGRPDPAGTEKLAGEMAAAGLADERIQQFRDGADRYNSVANSREVLEKPAAGDLAATDAGRRTTYSIWLMNEPEAALQWAEARGESDLVSQTVGSFADKLLESDWSPGRQMDTPWAESLRKQYSLWQRIAAPDADAWLATMPADIRKLVATPTYTPQKDATR